MKQKNARRRDQVADRWAEALGVSKQRLRALIRDVVNERRRDLLGATAGTAGSARRRPGSDPLGR